MKVIYIETSAVLSWLLGEPTSDFIINLLDQAGLIVTSVLTNLETNRPLHRAEKLEIHKTAEINKLLGLFNDEKRKWEFFRITDKIIEGSSVQFPIEPVRSLDAIHLATALEYLKVYPDLEILTFDERIHKNIIPLGLKPAI